MYLKTLYFENVGPIEKLELTAPFQDNNPQPIVLVGGNGSGKTITLSYVVNFLTTAQQQLYENPEVVKGKVYKLRSPSYIHSGKHHYYAKLAFEGGFEYEEWQLASSKKDFTNAFGYTPSHPSWAHIEDDAISKVLFPQIINNRIALKNLVESNVMQYFPSNRYEDPAWLNEANLSYRTRIALSQNIQGVTARKIISADVLDRLVSWLYELIYDSRVFETHPVTISPTPGAPPITILTPSQGVNTNLINTIAAVLGLVFQSKGVFSPQIIIGQKNNRQIGLNLLANGQVVATIPNLFSLSSGESLLLCLFCSILRDFELTRTGFTSAADVRGIVIVDEIDLHLHVDLQRKVLPQLIKSFPKVQFLVTTHSPLFLIGMDEVLGPDGYAIFDLPSGNNISPERFVEFARAYETYSSTRFHENSLRDFAKSITRPVLVTEGRSDKVILETAWSKLYPSASMPFDIRASGIGTDETKVTGNADTVRRTLELGATLVNQPIVGLFDNDRTGNEQFMGLNAQLFDSAAKLRKHKTKSVWGMLLPVPQFRKEFVSDSSPIYRYLEIEHYFSNDVLRSHNKAGEGILGTQVFSIIGDKMLFANQIASLDTKEFSAFAPLFDQINVLFGTSQVPPASQ